LTLGGSAYTAQQIQQAFQGLLDALTAADAARAAWEDALKKVSAQKVTVLPLARAYANSLITANGDASSVLADYGLTPRKARAPMTTAEQAAAVAKRNATRSARHTMGTQQKKGVHGDVTGVTVIPVVSAAPATVTTPSSPTAPASSSGGQAAAPAPAGSTSSGTTPVTATPQRSS
jgi:hypothetical protein